MPYIFIVTLINGEKHIFVSHDEKEQALMHIFDYYFQHEQIDDIQIEEGNINYIKLKDTPQEFVKTCCTAIGIEYEQLLHGPRRAYLTAARKLIIYALKKKYDLRPQVIADLLEMDRTNVNKHLALNDVKNIMCGKVEFQPKINYTHTFIDKYTPAIRELLLGD